jgi:integrase
MPSAWIAKKATSRSGIRYRVMFRVGGRESVPRYGGSFKTQREANARRAWIVGEFAAMRVPDLALLVEPVVAPTVKVMAERWQASRVDVADGTKQLHRVALGRVLPTLGDRLVDSITTADVAKLIEDMHGRELKRETIRKSVTVLAQTLDFAGIDPNPARDKRHVKLPREDAADMEPPTADHVEAVCWKLTVDYMLAALILDATGVRVGELEGAKLGDLDEERHAWLVRASVSKTRRARWVELPADLYGVLIGRLPAREDRDPDAPLVARVTADRLRTAIGRACRDAGVPSFSPHALRHRRISLLHRQGIDPATVGRLMGQRSKVVTLETYTHALIDSREVDRAKLLARVSDARLVQIPVQTPEDELAAFAG